MKKAIALFLALVSLVTISVPAHAAPATLNNNEEVASFGRVLIQSENRAEAEQYHYHNIAPHLEELGIDPADCTLIDSSTDIIPMNDPSNYAVEYLGPSHEWTDWFFPGNQGTYGAEYKENGGWIAYTPDGGVTQTFKVGFSSSIGSSDIDVYVEYTTGVPQGNASNGYPIEPGQPGYYKIKINKRYTVESYVVYNKRWNEIKWGYDWVLISQQDSYTYDFFDYDLVYTPKDEVD